MSAGRRALLGLVAGLPLALKALAIERVEPLDENTLAAFEEMISKIEFGYPEVDWDAMERRLEEKPCPPPGKSY